MLVLFAVASVCEIDHIARFQVTPTNKFSDTSFVLVIVIVKGKEILPADFFSKGSLTAWNKNLDNIITILKELCKLR